jgi:hypothetical protein
MLRDSGGSSKKEKGRMGRQATIHACNKEQHGGWVHVSGREKYALATSSDIHVRTGAPGSRTDFTCGGRRDQEKERQ